MLLASSEYEALIFPGLDHRVQKMKSFHNLSSSIISELCGLKEILHNVKNNHTQGL